VGIARALSFEGGQDVYEAFRRTLVDETIGRTQNLEEITALTWLVKSMAYLGRTEKAAYDFTVQGCNPEFWNNVSSYYRDGLIAANMRMVSSSIIGVGILGSSSALDHLKALRDRIGVDLPVTALPTSIFQGVYNYRMCEKHGITNLMDNMFEGMSAVKHIENWTKTKEGSEWWNWAMTVSGATPRNR
jgi:hypothetical protein